MATRQHPGNPTEKNIQAIVELERKALAASRWSDRVGDAISGFAGSLWFVLCHVILFTTWAAWNALASPELRFDPYPYGLLTFIVSLEGVLIATFVLIKQNRMAAQSDDDRYFTDTYQVMPQHGFTRMFERMLAHPNIKIMLNTDYREIEGSIAYDRVVFTGPIDEYLDYRFGRLPYRSLEFKFETLNVERHQGVAVVNYPNDNAFTRITEIKHVTGQEHAKTTLVTEYPRAEGDPYYSVPRPENAALYRQYQKLADTTEGVHFVGRLATYKYYNMDRVVAQALSTYSKIVGVPRRELLGA